MSEHIRQKLQKTQKTIDQIQWEIIKLENEKRQHEDHRIMLERELEQHKN